VRSDPTFKPRLRPVEVFRIPDAAGPSIGVRDRAGISDVVLSLSGPALHLMSLMDGEHTIGEIRAEFLAAVGRPVSVETLHTMIEHLDRAFFLEGARFEERYQLLLEAYRAQGVREMPSAAAMGLVDSFGGPLADMLESAGPSLVGGHIVGLVAPHLDYPRGRPCYTAAYGEFRGRATPDRVIVLGTNHFGRSASVVATAADFLTPLGRTRCDTAFLARLEARCGNLRRFEYDHVREHSVELQVAWLQHLFGASAFELVPLLCPDACGPTGTAAPEGGGAGLSDVATALGELVRDDPADTLIVAGADLSHVGAEFGDDRPLDDCFLEEVRQQDQRALEQLELGDPNGFVQALAGNHNPTRVCSAGCIFTLAAALPGSRATVLRYHQAVSAEAQLCVSCAAVAFAE